MNQSKSRYFFTCRALVLVLLFFVLLFLNACHLFHGGHAKKVKPVRDSVIVGAKCNLVWLKEQKLSKLIAEHEFKTTPLQCKANVYIQTETDQFDLDVKIRWIPDSTMWIHIQYVLGIDIAKLWVSRDSVVMINYINKSFLREDVSELNRWLNTELDFDLLQSLMFGNSAAYNEDQNRLHAFVNRDSCTYVLSTERKRKWKKINSGNLMPYAFFQILTIDHSSFKIVKNELQDPKTQRSLKISYSQFKNYLLNFAPQHVDIEMASPKPLRIKIDYVRMEPLDGNIKLPTVPKGYERVYPNIQN